MKNPRHELCVGSITLDQWVKWRGRQNYGGFDLANQLDTAKKIACVQEKSARELLLKLHDFATLHYNQLEEIRGQFVEFDDTLKMHFPDEVKPVVGK